MKKMFIIFLLAFLTTHSIEAAIFQNSIKTKTWESSIDYINTEVTNLYILRLNDKKLLKTKDQKAYFDIATELQNNSYNSAISFDRLKLLLSKDFNNTLNNLSTPINDLKKSIENNNFEELFNRIKGLVVAVESDIQNGERFNNLRSEFVKPPIKEDTTREKALATQKSATLPKTLDNDKGSNHYLPYILAIIFFCSTALFFIMWFKTSKQKEKLKTANNNLEKDELSYKDEVERYKRQLQNLQTNNKRVEYTYPSTPVHSSVNNTTQNEINDEKPREQLLNIDTYTAQIMPVNEYLYAGKPSENGILKDIATEPNNRSTIFKLSLFPDKKEEADFEVILVGDFMTRNITNSPDDYLYRVCNHENSNREFTKSIITIKKGRAMFQDGDWRVREENKATIKFQ